jgi:hypothetical protein
MHAELQQIGTVPPIWACRIYAEGCHANHDNYHNACIAVVQPDGIPEVMLFAIPMEDEKENPDAAKVAYQRCAAVRLALGEAFAAKGWSHYIRVLPRSGKRIMRKTLPVDDCDD